MKIIINWFDYLVKTIINWFDHLVKTISLLSKELVDFALSLDTDEITIISIILTVLIYVLSRRSELRFRKHESKRDKYDYFITYIVNFFSHSDEINKGQLEFFNKMKEDYYQLGANLAIYGSSKLYKEYCFLRRITTDEILREQKYFDNYLIIVSFAKMFKIIRREVGLNNDFISIPKTLSFAINDITKPELMIKYYRNRYNRIMLKFMIIGSNIKSFHWPLYIFYVVIKPLIIIPLMTISLLILNLIIKPIGFILKNIRNVLRKL